MPWKFISGEWRKLIMVNYEVEPDILKPFIPSGTKLNFYNGKCFVTLSGFIFKNIKTMGVTIPFHNSVDEISLRFYVIPDGANQQERGVVFIRESVPKPLIAFSANFFYKEHYDVRSVKHLWNSDFDHQQVQYFWKNSRWNFMVVKAGKKAHTAEHGSEEEFISQQLRGYTKVSENKTFRYIVKHPPWSIYPVTNSEVYVNFKNEYGENFGFLESQKPSSIFLAEGSPISIMMREKL